MPIECPAPPVAIAAGGGGESPVCVRAGAGAGVKVKPDRTEVVRPDPPGDAAAAPAPLCERSPATDTGAAGVPAACPAGPPFAPPPSFASLLPPEGAKEDPAIDVPKLAAKPAAGKVPCASRFEVGSEACGANTKPPPADNAVAGSAGCATGGCWAEVSVLVAAAAPAVVGDPNENAFTLALAPAPAPALPPPEPKPTPLPPVAADTPVRDGAAKEGTAEEDGVEAESGKPAAREDSRLAIPIPALPTTLALNPPPADVPDETEEEEEALLKATAAAAAAPPGELAALAPVVGRGEAVTS